MSVVFADSFDHYTNLLSKWSGVGGDNTIRVSTGAARTGTSCVQINTGAFGPFKQGLPQMPSVLVASAYYSSGQSLALMANNYSAHSGDDSCLFQLQINADGSLSVIRGNGFQLMGTSAPALFHFNSYNSIAIKAAILASATVFVYCNGHLVLSVPGVDTRNQFDTSKLWCDGFRLFGTGGSGGTCFHDDVYVLNTADTVNNDYLGALRVYASPPNADAVVIWTPFPGSPNFSNVNEIPPDDNTSYNSSAVIGDVDQYVHPLNSSVPANSQIFAVQHCQDLEVDSGSRSVTSDVGGHVSPASVALSNPYLIYSWPYDVNPVSGVQWLTTDFPANFGPKVTA